MSESVQEQVAMEVQVFLKRAKISPRQAALKLGWDNPDYLYRRLRSEVSFSIVDLEKIAGLLELEVADFVPSNSVRPRDVPGVSTVNKRYLSPSTATPLGSAYGRAA